MLNATRGIALGVAAAALFAGCQPDFVINKERQPILGGTLVTDVGPDGQFPTVVAIFNGGLCTGTLVAPDLILTAAHCIDPNVLGFASQQQVTDNTIVVFDTNDLFDQTQGFAVAALETSPNPGFNIQALGDDDIGFVVLETPVTDRAPSPIDLDPARNLIGSQVIQVGYGISQTNANGTPNQNSAGTLFNVNKTVEDCGFFGLSNDRLVCFDQTDGSGSCSGDSGGPSFEIINGVPTVIGVTSFGDQNCEFFGAYTRTAGEVEFVEDALGGDICNSSSDGICDLGCNNVDPDCGPGLEVGEVAGCAVSANASPKGALATLLLLALAFLISRRRRS